MREKLQERLETARKIIGTRITTNVGNILASFAGIAALFFFIGLVVFGWWLWPVEWQYPEPPPGMNGLEYTSKATYTLVVSEWYAYSGNDQKLYFFSSQFSDFADVACQLADESVDVAQQARLIKVAYLQNGYGCDTIQDR